jgi:hypothetical protein
MDWAGEGNSAARKGEWGMRREFPDAENFCCVWVGLLGGEKEDGCLCARVFGAAALRCTYISSNVARVLGWARLIVPAQNEKSFAIREVGAAV